MRRPSERALGVPGSFKLWWTKLRERPFPRLVQHFVTRLLAASDAGESSIEIGAGAALAILALPGAFFCIFLLDKYSSLLQWMRQVKSFDPISASLPDKYFLIAFSMAITGLVTVLRWDRILPNHQDYSNLAVLPIHPRRVFFANLLAAILVAAVFTLDVNAASTILFPMIVTGDSGTPALFLRSMLAHATAVLTASAFSFAACFAVLGSLMVTLPQRWFRAVALWVRGLMVTALLALLIFGFTGVQIMRNARTRPDAWTNLLPTVWFTSLYHWLQSNANPELASFAKVAWQATIATTCFALVIYALGYRRSYLHVPEGSGANSATGPSLLAVWIDPLFGATGPARAAGMFALRTLVRGETHSMIAGASLGLGAVLSSIAAMTDSSTQGLTPATLSIPLILVYFLLTGLRAAFEVPAELGANWAFQITPASGEFDPRQVARRVLLLATALVLIPTFAASAVAWNVTDAALHTLFVACAAVVLTELLLLDFRKIPFSCSLPQPRNHAVIYVFVYFAGLGVFAGVLSQVAALLVAEPLRFLVVPVVAIPAALWWRSMLRQEPSFDRSLTFQEQEIRAVQTLNIFDRSM